MENWGPILSPFRDNLLSELKKVYPESVREYEQALYTGVFINSAKIPICWLGGGICQPKSFLFGGKLFNCLMDQTVMNPEVLRFHICGPGAGQRQSAGGHDN